MRILYAYKPVFCLAMTCTCLVMLTAGCDKKEMGEADEFIRNAPPADQQILSDFHSQKPENILNEGLINLRAGELEKAITLLEKFTQYYPDNPTGQFYLGQAYYKNDMYEEAIIRLKRAYQSDNSNTAALFYLGLSYRELGKEQEAINALLTYLLSESGTVNAYRVADEINRMAKPMTGRYVIDKVYLTEPLESCEETFSKPKMCFPSNTREILAAVQVRNAPKGTDIEGKWKYVVSQEEKKVVATSSFTAEGTDNIALPFPKPPEGFLPGEYELEILVDKGKNICIKFYVF